MYVCYKENPKFLLTENYAVLHSLFYSLQTKLFGMRTAFWCTADGTM